MLTPAQEKAIAHIRNSAMSRKTQAIHTIDHILRMSNFPRSKFDHLIEQTKSNARVAFHFHPDRLDPQMKSVAEAILECGIYKSQFETLISSGSVSAHPGGARDLWESQLFGGAYQQQGVDNSQRPKYGALDLLSHPHGPSPRFGSCYFLLKPEVTQRCTFTYRDSHLDPKEKGTLEEFDDILASLLSDSFSDELALGMRLRPPQLFERLSASLKSAIDEGRQISHHRNLDHYIEAQVHGEVSLGADVDDLIADPSFKETAIGKCLEDICQKYDIHLRWHSGFVLQTSKVPSDFRGATMPSLAKRVAPEGQLNVKMIGDAAASLRKNPESWIDRGTESDVLQELKLLWHVLLKYGAPG